MATLFLGGDVMIGRAIDQILPAPCPPILYEPVIQDARVYVELAREESGPLPAVIGLDYVWGDASSELERVKPDTRIINLETSITRSDDHWPDKEIHYRASPENARCLATAGIDICSLANNHVLDWGHAGLEETITTLDQLGIAHAGAGRDAETAARPARVDLSGGGRVLVFAFTTPSSGTPDAWAATPRRAGVRLLADGSSRTIRAIGDEVARWYRRGDLVVASIHWGGNWSYRVPSADQRVARALVDEAGVHVVHGHSSHHVKGIEVHGGHLILYGCGDLLSDYEGIGGYEAYRGDLGLMYFATLAPATGELERLEMTPTRLRRLQVTRATPDDGHWLADTLCREGAAFGTSVELGEHGRLQLRWS